MSQFYIGSTSSGPLPPTVPTSFITDSGTAIPATNVIYINGGPGIDVIANPDGSNKILITETEVAANYTNVVAPPGGFTYVVLITDYFISVDATLGPVTIRMLQTPNTNQQFIIKDRLGFASVNPIIIEPAGGTTIDGQASYTFSDNYESLECLFHGTNYEGF